ncbi:MAG TPA: hypothetical protein VFT55_11090 [Planctomycetota bacterium]|nr:hypothetical protein [Planctomycetota bacterium]
MRLLTVLVSLVAAANGQNELARPADKPSAAKAPFVFEPGVVELRTLIERCGSYLQRNILVDDSELMPAKASRSRVPAPAAAAGADNAPPGPFVELQLPVVTDRDGCEELLTSLLWARGLALVPLDEPKRVYEVVSLNGPRAREIPLRAVLRTPEQVLARPTLRQFVSVVYTLKHTRADMASNALRPFFTASGNWVGSLNLGNVGNQTSIVLSGPQDLVASGLLLLQTADVPQPPEAKTDPTVRLDALAQQHEQVLQRVAALEEKVGRR